MAKYVVRYGAMRLLGVYAVRGNEKLERGAQVIARTDRGLEAGEVLAAATDESIEHLSHAGHGQILRRMSTEDLNEWHHIQSQTRVEFETCQRFVRQLGLAMELVDLERLFGGERMVIYYLSEDRVDFRELVRLLAAEFQTRIEMRQIGVRDEAKLLADYGDCGKPVCCNTHLSAMPPVSMKMAKLQKATLDPTKISGRCGRLKCCLRYEYDTYVDLQRELPPPGAEVLTREGRSRVISQAILAQQLLVETEDHRRVLIQAADVLTVLRKGGKGGKQEPAPEDDSGEEAESVAARRGNSPRPAGRAAGEPGKNPAGKNRRPRPERDGRSEGRGESAEKSAETAATESDPNPARNRNRRGNRSRGPGRPERRPEGPPPADLASPATDSPAPRHASPDDADSPTRPDSPEPRN